MRFIAVLAFGASLVCVSPAASCSIVASTKPTAIGLIQRADVIVVAVAREPYPAARDHIRFEVTETLKGKAVAPLIIEGALTDRDDFNNAAVPANGVRPDGLGGSCFASSYRPGAAYLLILQRTTVGKVSPYWAPLSRVNDQIRPNGDRWLDWVRRQVAQRP
jgi:hypothetical protein